MADKEEEIKVARRNGQAILWEDQRTLFPNMIRNVQVRGESALLRSSLVAVLYRSC